MTKQKWALLIYILCIVIQCVIIINRGDNADVTSFVAGFGVGVAIFNIIDLVGKGLE